MDNLSKSSFGRHIDELPSPAVAGLIVGEWESVGIVVVMACPSERERAADRVAAFAASRQTHVMHSGPGQWLIIYPSPANLWLGDLADELDGTAQLFDQSSGFALLTLRGLHARDVLQKGLFVDLAAALCADGMSLGSVIAHISVTVWRLAPDVFGVALPRSYGSSFWHWLEATTRAESLPLGRVAQALPADEAKER